MHKFYLRWTVCLCIALFLVISIGCEDKPTPTPTPTPAQKFLKDQEKTVTPHGKINPSSVKDNDGKIDYETADGSKWKTDPPTNGADGIPKYGEPEKRK